MRRAARWGAVAAALLPAGCMPPADKACVLMSSDFEQFEGWVSPLPSFLTKEQAHSGRYSYRMAAGAEFGPGFSMKLEHCPFIPRRMRLSGWVYLPSGRIRSTMLVVSINCHGRRPDVWQGMDIDMAVPRYQVWVPVQKAMKLPDDLEPTDELKFYVWHNDVNGELLFLDDLKLEAWE